MHALPVASAPARAPAEPRTGERLLTGPLLTLAIGVCAAVPVIAAAARALHEGFQPVADRGIIATRAYDVFSSHTPLVGQYSFAGAVTGKLTYSLGPLLYWLLAPAAHIGAPQSFVYTMAAVNVACVLAAVALARRRGGVWLMLAAAAAIALMCRSIAANNFYDIWNPSAGLFPLLALIFLCWSLACGDYRLLPVTVLVGSFELQCEDAFIPPSLAALAVGLGGFALWWIHGRRRKDPDRPRTVWRWVLGALLVFCICWTPTFVDQVAHSGNLSKVEEAASERRSPLGATVGAHAVVRTIGVVPWWLHRVGYPFQRKHDVLHSQGTLATVSAALILAWLLLAIALAIRRRRRTEAAGAVLALALSAAVWSIAEATPSTPRFLAETLGYTLWSATTIGMFAWLVTLHTFVELSGAGAWLTRAFAATAQRARAGASRAAVGLAAIAVAAAAGAVGAAAGTPDEHAFEFHALQVINAHLGAVPRGHSVFLNARLDGLITPLRPEMTYDLRRRGVRALGNGAFVRTGHWYERSEHPYDYIVWVYDDNRLPVPSARVIARAHIRTNGRLHTVTVALSHLTPREQASEHSRPPARKARVPATHHTGSVAALAWSAPAELPGCATGGPEVAFPSEGPFDATGPGAIVWVRDDAACRGAPRSASPQLVVSQLGAGARVLASRAQPLRFRSPPALAAVGASLGRVAVALAPVGSPAEEPAALLEGRTGARLNTGLHAVGGLALARAYLGDVAVATVEPHAISVRLQRWFGGGFGRPLPIPIGAGAVSSLTVTLDYRSDVLVAWQQNGSIYAHVLRASGVRQQTQRVGSSGPEPQLRALVSDNNHGMLAWSNSEGSGASARTRIELAFSADGVRFLPPKRLAEFTDPLGSGRVPGSLELVRLSTENVLLAWTAREAGRYVVRAAPAVFAATRPSALLSSSTDDAVLEDLATGPGGEAVALWRASATPAHFSQQAPLWSARVMIERGDRPVASAARMVASARAVAGASVAVDPASDAALAAWRVAGAGAHVEFAVGAGAGRYRPHSAGVPTPTGGGTHWLRIMLAALALIALVFAAGLLRARPRRHAAR